MAWVEHDYPRPEALASAVAVRLANQCLQAIAERGRAILALAGGRTPFPCYAAFAQLDLPWSRVHVIATDERCVPLTHPASNTAELQRAFAAARGIEITALIAADGDADHSEARARELLAHTTEAFDAVLLGMGNDAHTASLFPQATQLPAAMSDPAEAAYRIDPQPLPPDAPFARISLSLRRLLHCRSMHLLITGDAKRSVLRRAQAEHDPLRMPISGVLHAHHVQAQIHWSP
ncbi:MAG: 6-phosphogluconolactonase [Pseudomarimonas sp.]